MRSPIKMRSREFKFLSPIKHREQLNIKQNSSYNIPTGAMIDATSRKMYFPCG